MMKITAIEAAIQFVNDEFPECEIAILAGSTSRGEETKTSDLDILIFDSNISDYRESFVRYGWRIECFVNNNESCLKHFRSDREKGRPVLATMIIEGKVLRDEGLVEKIKEEALLYIKQGPTPLTSEFIRASRYFMYDLLDDFIDAKSEEEEIILINTISIQLADFILRLNGQWSGRGKTLTRALKNYNSELSDRFFSALNTYYRDRNKQPIVEFINDIYEPIGGQLFDGFSMGKS
jgi:hypothetical protein